MAHVAKIACSLDARLLARVEAARRKTGESRSAYVSRALRAITAEDARAKAVARYVEVWRDCPETEDEAAFADWTAKRAFAGLPWEDE